TYLPLDKSDPRGKTTIRELMNERTAGGKQAEAAAHSLVQIAEKAAGNDWDSLFSTWLAKPLDMEKTSYPLTSANSSKVLSTTVRDYGRLLSALVTPPSDVAPVISPGASDLLFRSAFAGARACASQTDARACDVIEQDAVGVYAWVDR